MPTEDRVIMGRYRALLTDTDREYLKQDPEDMNNRNKRDQTVTRTRSRLRALEDDIKVLKDHHTDLLEELQEIVCESTE